jgi:hypothetical protein
MRMRCNNKDAKSYAEYGGRGIKVCERWGCFENFLADMGERPPGKTLERQNNDGDYEPSNCCWATALEQSQNRRSSRLVTFNGETLSISAWARRLGMSHTSLNNRLKKWSVEKSLTTPTGSWLHRITINGVTKNVSEWSRSSGVERSLIHYRLKCGWLPERAIFQETSR